MEANSRKVREATKELNEMSENADVKSRPITTKSVANSAVKLLKPLLYATSKPIQ